MQFNFGDDWGDDGGFFAAPAPVPVQQPQPPVVQPQQQPQKAPQQQQQPPQQQQSAAEQQPPPQAYNSPPMVDPLGCQDGWGPSTSAFGQSLDQPYQATFSGQPQSTFAPAETFVEPPVQTEKKDVEAVEEVQTKQVEQEQPKQQSFSQKSAAIRGTSSQNNGGWSQPLQKRAPKTTQPAAEPLGEESVEGLRSLVKELIGRVQALENERYLIQNTICTLNSNGTTHGRMNFNEKIVEKISWGNDSHIMAPEKGMILNNDKTVLTIEHAGIYHIVFNTLGKNPKIVIDGNVFAGAKSDKCSAVVDFIVSLGSNAKICAVVEQKCPTEATDTWLSVRLLSGF